MPQFEPRANDDFSLRILAQEKRFRAVEHPNAPGMAHAMEGLKATVYRVRNLDTRDDDYALKVMKRKYRTHSLEELCSNLDKLKHLPGLVVCERRCLSPSVAEETIEQHRDLEYAILMPWVQGQSWFDVLYLGKKGRSLFSKAQSFQVASNLAEILCGLEKAQVAHCDLSAGNIIVDPGKLQIELVDVEEIFAPGLNEPNFVAMGTPGYQHRTSGQGHWHTQADRFAAAILLGEMLGWYDSSVRVASYGESYFDKDELQSKRCQRFEILVKAVSNHREDLADLLKLAWESNTLDECPSLRQWNQTLNAIKKEYAWKEIPFSSSIGAKVSPFWMSLSQPRTTKPEGVAVHWGAPIRAAPPKEPELTPVHHEESTVEQASHRTSSGPVEWIRFVTDSPDEKENGKAH